MNPPNHPLYGILLILGAVMLFASHDGIAKYLTMLYPPMLVVWARFMTQTVLMLVVYAPHMGLDIVRTQRPKLQLVRSLSMILASICFVTGLRYVPIGEATAVLFLSPLVITWLSARLLKERIRAGQWVAVVFGLVGVLVIVRPGSALFTPAILFPLGTSICMAVYQMLTRQVLATDHPVASNFITSLVCFLLMSMTVTFFWQTPTWSIFLLVLVQGAFAMAGHMCMTHAYRYATAATLAPFTYAQILFAALVGLVFFGHVPDQATLVGMAIIICSGLGLVWWQRR